jgi:hypothetical protein
MACSKRLASDVESTRSKALVLARRALRCAPDDPEVLAFAGFTLAHCGEDINVALGLIERALSLNPSFARGWLQSGVARLLAVNPISRLSDLRQRLDSKSAQFWCHWHRFWRCSFLQWAI